jgi:small GTP-binding protein
MEFKPEWKKAFEDMEIISISDLANFTEPLEIEGIEENDVSKLAMLAEMINWHVSQLGEKGDLKKKVVLLGLDNAGKTSVLTALSEQYSAIKQILPTRGLKRQSISIFGYDIMSFDMGGQAEYRDQYFKKMDMYFSAADLVLYCVDIQDTKRYDESLEYLKEISKAFESFKIHPPILVAFTKTDPDLVSNQELNKSQIAMIGKVEEICKKHDVEYINTSIFERNSIENLFSMVLRKLSTSNAVIEFVLNRYLKEIKGRAGCLVSTNGLVYGSVGESRQEEEMLSNSANYLQNLYLFHLNSGLQKDDSMMLQYRKNSLYLIAEHITTIDNAMIYLWVMTHDLHSEASSIAKLKEELIPLIKIFL